MADLEKVFRVKTPLRPCFSCACSSIFEVLFALFWSRGLINSVQHFGEQLVIIHERRYFMKLDWNKKSSGRKQWHCNSVSCVFLKNVKKFLLLTYFSWHLLCLLLTFCCLTLLSCYRIGHACLLENHEMDFQLSVQEKPHHIKLLQI